MKFTKKEVYEAFKDYVNTVVECEGVSFDNGSNPVIRQILKELDKQWKEEAEEEKKNLTYLKS